MSDQDNLRVKRSTTVYKNMRDSRLISQYYRINTAYISNKKEIYGASPTDIFIGRYGYPKVFAGPMVPPRLGDTSILASPESWRSMSISDIFNMRFSLVRGMFITDVRGKENGREIEKVRELAMSTNSVYSEVNFSKSLYTTPELGESVEPFGLSGKISSFDITNTKADNRIEDKYLDTDATAKDSVIELYDKGVAVSKITRAFSAGLFGTGANRKLVPTRWSITAVDDTISKQKVEEIKGYEEIDHIEVYYNVSLDNRWMIVVMPGQWGYESIEAWYPNTAWNENPNEVSIFSSSEGYNGRKGYAEIGGCYYAARLAVAEKLHRIRKQAKILILREVHDGYVLPVGVWNVREHVRETLDGRPIILDNEAKIVDMISERFDITPKEWLRNSTILKSIFLQMQLSKFF